MITTYVDGEMYALYTKEHFAYCGKHKIQWDQLKAAMDTLMQEITSQACQCTDT